MAHLLACVLALPLLAPSPGAGAPKLRALVLDGQSNHDWRRTSVALRATLEASGRFEVEVATSPAERADRAAWEAWRPGLEPFDLLVSNLNDGGRCLYSAELRADVERFVAGGGGLVVVHSADNASADWRAWNRMIGVGGWGGRDASAGSQLRLVDGAWRADAAPDGESGAHGPLHAFEVVHDAPEHPVLAGLPRRWMHAEDELYDSLRGPCERVEVLASAHSARTGRREPVLIAIGYGAGRVFHTTLGHVGALDAVHCVGFQTSLARGAEWAATGAVTIAAPLDFPGRERPSVVAPEDVRWLGAPALALLGPGTDEAAARALLRRLALSDPSAWRAGVEDGRAFLELGGASDYAPPHRSPLSIALLDRRAGDFVLELELAQTGREYDHRDLCVVFGFQDPTRYYYAHVATRADESAHGIFLVDGAPRRRLAGERTQGHDWSARPWHRLRLVRELAGGAIELSIEGERVMRAQDRSLGAGWIGFGSFDDQGRFRALRLWSASLQEERAPAFERGG